MIAALVAAILGSMSDTAGPSSPAVSVYGPCDPAREELTMANPWTKKNPLLSMWLSGANAVAGKARSAGAGFRCVG